jgi:phosphatidylserine/phosphatidylglycerophosphate/cardiolipin synthase-like enzyme
VSIGSYNFDHRSLAYNLEMVVNVLDEGATKDTIAMLESDIADSEELTRETFGGRPLLMRLAERLAYAFRKWL